MKTTAHKSSIQMKITLPTQIEALIKSKADQFGLSPATYIRHLVLEDAMSADYPTYQASPAVEEAYREAKKAEKNGRLIETTDLEAYLESL